MIPTKFWFIWLSSFRGEDFLKISTNQKQESSVVAMFINRSGGNKQSLQSGSHAQIPYLQQCKVKSRNQGT
jgi:hypothetical protein